MGIVLVRVDDRLVHGQIVEAWAPFCRATCILVVSDEVKNNRIQRIAMEACVPKTLKIKVIGASELEDAQFCAMDTESVIIIFPALKDIMLAYNNGFRFSNLNIGNIHHDGTGTVRRLTPSVFIDKEDEEILRNLLNMGIEFDIRTVPSDRPVDLVSLLH